MRTFQYFILIAFLSIQNFITAQIILDDRFNRVDTLPFKVGSRVIHKVYFKNGQNGSVITSKQDGSSVLYYTENGGIDWDSIQPNIQFIQPNNGNNEPSFVGIQIDSVNNQLYLANLYLENSQQWTVKRIFPTLVYYQQPIIIHRFDSNRAIIFTSYLTFKNSVLEGIYFTDNNFESLNLVSNDIVDNYIGTESSFKFWSNHRLVTINSNGQIGEENLYLHRAEHGQVDLEENDNFLVIRFTIDSTSDYGIYDQIHHGTYLRDKVTNLTKINIDEFGNTNIDLVENILYSPGYYMVETDLNDSDSSLKWNYIEQYSPGDVDYVFDHRFSSCYSPNKCYVLGFVPGIDDKYVLFHSSVGQGGYKFSVKSNHNATLEEKENKTLSLSPNPTNYSIQLIGDISQYSKMEVYDFLGQKVYSTLVSESNRIIDVNRLASGLYLVKLFDSSGNLNGETEFIKE